MKNTLRLFAVAFVLAAGVSAHALEPTTSASFKVSYSNVQGVGAVASSASFQARGSVMGQDNKRVQSTQDLPVSVSAFTID